MAPARTTTAAVEGVDGHLVEIQADLADGPPGFTASGLPKIDVHSTRDRIRAAIFNSGEDWPIRHIMVNLTPATAPRPGSMSDAALALAVLAAAGAVPGASLTQMLLLGELGLDGRLRATRGVLPAVTAAARAGIRRAIVPIPNLAEARLVPGVDVRGIADLADLLAFLRGESDRAMAEPPMHHRPRRGGPDLADLAGQDLGRRALEIAAAGGHHLLLTGPPGSGKIMLAERLPDLLPPLQEHEALEVAALHSVAGLLPADAPLQLRPPFQAPHHTVSAAAMIGGGSTVRPGAVSLAHHGVLLLADAPEFPPSVLDTLRGPLEHGEVTIARSGGTTRYAARFQLVMTADPCACAASADESGCHCTPLAKQRYRARISGPLLDRVDLQVTLQQSTPHQARSGGLQQPGEGSGPVAVRIAAARAAAATRLQGSGWSVNADVPAAQLRTRWRLPAAVTAAADNQLDRGALSTRGYHRILRVAWTISDLAGSERPTGADIAEALTLRAMAAPPRIS